MHLILWCVLFAAWKATFVVATDMFCYFWWNDTQRMAGWLHQIIHISTSAVSIHILRLTFDVRFRIHADILGIEIMKLNLLAWGASNLNMLLIPKENHYQ